LVIKIGDFAFTMLIIVKTISHYRDSGHRG